MCFDWSRIRIKNIHLSLMPFICGGKYVYFGWSRIRINKCLCKVHAFDLRVKELCILFGLEFILSN